MQKPSVCRSKISKTQFEEILWHDASSLYLQLLKTQQQKEEKTIFDRTVIFLELLEEDNTLKGVVK